MQLRWPTLQAVSLTSKESEAVTLHTATLPTAISLRRLDRENRGSAAQLIGQLLVEADQLCGGRCTPEEIVMLARMTFGNFSHRSVESLVLALKEGMNRTDNEGRIYDKLTWPKVHLWLKAHEDAVMALASDDHSKVTVKNDNLGADYMDRQEHKAGAKDRLIDQLKRKLDAKSKAE